jgi:tetratricopeptide (TPR) repeat protein
MTRTVKWSISLAVALAFCLFFAAAIGWSIYLFRQQQRQQSALIEGYQAVRNNDCETAIAKFTEALQGRLTKYAASEAYANRAYCHSVLRRREEALRDYEESIRRYPKFAWVFAYRGAIHEEGGDSEKAFDDYSAAIRLDANAAETFRSRARIFLARREVAKAIEDLKEAIRVAPKNAEYYAALGAAQVEANDLDRARASLDTAIALDPALHAAYATRAEVHRLAGRWENAAGDRTRATLTGAIVVHGGTQADGAQGTGIDFFNGGVRALETGQYDRAIDCFNKALARQLDRSTASKAYMNRGNAYLQTRDFAKAESDYDKAIIEDSHNAGAHVNRASLYVSKDPAAAIEKCTAAIAIDPNLSEAYIVRGVALADKKRPREALADFKKAIEFNSPRVDVALNAIAWTRATSTDADLRNADEAINAAVRACEMTAWQSADHIDTLAAAYAEKGEFDKAVEWQMKAAALLATADESLRNEIQGRVELYRQRQPHRED